MLFALPADFNRLLRNVTILGYPEPAKQEPNRERIGGAEQGEKATRNVI